MRYISLFSGFGGAELAFGPLGWECAAVAEVEPAACAVLAHHWPHVPNLGDVEKITEEQIALLGPVDMVVFGSPCQDLSVAGKREGLKGERSGLFFDAMRIVRWSRARFALWENVPGAFSSQEGRDFALVVGEMAGVRIDVPNGGWRNSGFLAGDAGLVEWAVLDAQYFGVPQRRRRIFALRDIGDWQSRRPILLERESLCGHPAPSRKAGQVAPTIPARSLGGGGLGTDFDCDGGAIASTGDISHCLNGGGMGRQDYETETLISFQNTGHGYWQQRPIAQTVRTPDGGGSLEANLVTHSLSADGFDASEDGTGRGTPLVPVAFSAKDYGADIQEGITPTLRAGGADKSHANSGNWMAVSSAGMQVRRLTPIETARLQGVPDDHCRIPHKRRKMADGPIYKMHGNGFCVNVVRWIGEAIDRITEPISA